jgi:hypothetical protein
MMLSRWASVGVGQVGLAIHLYPTPAERPTSYPVLDESGDAKLINGFDNAVLI